MVDVSAKLRQNAAEDYLAYIKIACAARRGVSFLLMWLWQHATASLVAEFGIVNIDPSRPLFTYEHVIV